MKKLFYMSNIDNEQIQYSIEILRKCLRKLDIILEKTDEATCRPIISIECKNNVNSQKYSLRWFPSGDIRDYFHSYYSFVSEENSTLSKIYNGDKSYLESGVIEADSTAGVMYGVLDFCELCDLYQDLPLRYIDSIKSPHLKLRSACLQLMKAGVYSIDITKEEFPWFYDRDWWIEYLDFMATNRYNAVTIWNYFPFPYFVDIPGYENTCPINQEQLNENRDLMQWLNTELKRRNMSLIFHFYCVYVPKKFAVTYEMSGIREFTEDQRTYVYDYISKCITMFSDNFESIGIMPCLGEGIPGGEAERFAEEVIIPALKKSINTPLLVIRQWASLTIKNVKKYLLNKYDNMYIMMKHNGEHIATEVPDARIKSWIDLGIPFVVNMHMLTEIGPFRWAPTEFIQRICLNYTSLGVNGIHVYPHWSWRTPGVGDIGYFNNEIYRDKLYHEAFGRYSFDPIRDADEEKRFWINKYSEYYSTKEKATAVIDALNIVARSLIRIQQHLWIHYDNHSVLSAGFLLSNYYGARSTGGRKIVCSSVGNDILPLSMELRAGFIQNGNLVTIEEFLKQSKEETEKAIELLLQANITDDCTEAGRVLMDIILIQLVICHLEFKVLAVRMLNSFFVSKEIESLKACIDNLRSSLDVYKELAQIGEHQYVGISDVFPNIPIRVDPDNMDISDMPYKWSQIIPIFEMELNTVELTYSHISLGENIEKCAQQLYEDLKINNIDDGII